MQHRTATHRHILGWSAFAALLILVAGCGSDDSTNPPACNFIQISAPKATIAVGEALDLTGTVLTPDMAGACVGAVDQPLDWTVDTARVTLETAATGVGTITVRGKAIGTVHITVSTADSTVSGFGDIVVSRFDDASLTH